MDSLSLEPDSIRFLYHYYSAAIDEIQGNNSLEKVEHLRLAKYYIETLPALGLGVNSYPEIVWVLGKSYQELDLEDKAIHSWEDGLVKCYTLYKGFSQKQKEDFNSTINGLASIYEKRGMKSFADRLRITQHEVFTNSFDYASDLIAQAIQLIEDGKANDALELLVESEIILPTTGEQDYQLLYVPLYRTKVNAFSEVSNIEQLQYVLPKLKKHLKTHERDWYDQYIKDISASAVRLANHEDYLNALKVLEIAKLEAKQSNKDIDDITEKTESNIMFFYSLKQKSDSLLFCFSNAKDFDEWIHISNELTNVYLRKSQYYEAYKTALQLYNKVKRNNKKHFLSTLHQVKECAIIGRIYDEAYPYIIEYEKEMLRIYGLKSKEYAEIRNQHTMATMESKQ